MKMIMFTFPIQTYNICISQESLPRIINAAMIVQVEKEQEIHARIKVTKLDVFQCWCTASPITLQIAIDRTAPFSSWRSTRTTDCAY